MALTLSVTTGDVTTQDRRLRTFSVTCDRPPDEVTLSFNNALANIDRDEWNIMLDQIRTQELVKRYSQERLDPPLSNPDMFAVLQQIRSTPTLQLFLAGIDISVRIHLVSAREERMVTAAFRDLEDWVASATAKGGLMFLPE